MGAAIIHAVMLVITFNPTTGAITHSQADFGFPSLEACRGAMPKVVAAVTPDLNGDDVEVTCHGLKTAGMEL